MKSFGAHTLSLTERVWLGWAFAEPAIGMWKTFQFPTQHTVTENVL